MQPGGSPQDRPIPRPDPATMPTVPAAAEPKTETVQKGAREAPTDGTRDQIRLRRWAGVLAMVALLAGGWTNGFFQPSLPVSVTESELQGVTDDAPGTLRHIGLFRIIPVSPDVKVEGVPKDIDRMRIALWDHGIEDGDYVQVLADDVPVGAPFMIQHRPVYLDVPAHGTIAVKGIRDGINGISYALHVAANGKTYFQLVPPGSVNHFEVVR